MKYNKKKLVLILTIIIIVAVIILIAITPRTKKIRGEKYFVGEDFYYQIDENDDVTLNKVIDETKKDIEIPIEIDGHTVIGLGYTHDKPSLWTVMYKGVFEDNKAVESIYIPDNIEFIKKEAFQKSNIKSVVIDSENIRLGPFAFCECRELKEVKFLKNIKIIETQVFSECESLEEIELPKGVERIEPYAFSGCTSLKKIVLFDEIEFIADDAFEWSDNVTIYGIKGSYAENYANEHNIPFVELD